MPVAAVPKYLGQDFKEASPGMRFGHLLPIWTDRKDQEASVNNRAAKKSREGQEVSKMLHERGMDATIHELTRREGNPLEGLWDINDFAARTAWKSICELRSDDQNRMKALLARQEAAYQTASPNNILRLEAQATAPFTTGLGNEHPLENGFAFLNPYGLPYLPGSGVKGVLRQAARELASGEWGDSHGWSEQKTIELSIDKKTVGISMLDALFGLESKDGDKKHLRGALTFWDVIPQIAGNSLAVEIMTPHQSHYYQWKKDSRGNLIEVSPHDSGSPNPISFLTVPPGSGFSFFVTCDTALLDRHAPELVKEERWKTLLQAAFEHAFAWLGFGAKTAVGYGAMWRDSEKEQHAERKRLEDAQRKADAERRATLSPEDLAHEENLKRVETFRQQFEAARKTAYQPGRAFDQQRLDFMKTALEWTDPRSRQAAGELLAETMSKTWGTPGKKERKQQISEATQKLKGNA